MKKLIPSLGLAKLTILTFSQFVVYIITKMTENAANFPTLAAQVAAIKLKLLAYDAAVTDAEKFVSGALALRNQLRVELSIMLKNLAAGCVLVANGDAALFLTSGFKLRKTPQPAPDPLDAAANVRLVQTTNESELRVLFEPVDYAKSYELFLSESDDQHFAYMVTISSQRFLLRNLLPGKRYFVKVRAVGPKGIMGGFSSVASKIAA